MQILLESLFVYFVPKIIFLLMFLYAWVDSSRSHKKVMLIEHFMSFSSFKVQFEILRVISIFCQKNIYCTWDISLSCGHFISDVHIFDITKYKISRIQCNAKIFKGTTIFYLIWRQATTLWYKVKYAKIHHVYEIEQRMLLAYLCKNDFLFAFHKHNS